MNHFSKRVLPIILAAVMTFSNVGMTAFAQEDAAGLASTEALVEAAGDASTEAGSFEYVNASSEASSAVEATREATADATIEDESTDGDTAGKASTTEGDSSALASTTEATDAASEASSREDAAVDASSEASSGEDSDASDEASSIGSSEDALLGAGEETEPETALEFHVGPGYVGCYTDEDIEEYIRENYTEEEISPEYDEDQPRLYGSAVGGLRSAMIARKTSYSYSSGSFNPAADIASALKDTDETDPTSGDYIKGNFIGYSASGSSGGSGWNINITLIWASYGNPASEEKQVDNKVKELVTELELDSTTLTEFQKVCRIHEYLVSHITYHDDGKYGCHGTYAALINNACVCQGYANAFTRLTREAGLASKYVVGMQINHAWNLVRVLGGTEPDRPWYNMDVTWSYWVDYDDPSTFKVPGYFLLNDIEFMGHPRDGEFIADSYLSSHPIALNSWGDTATGQYDLENPEYSFTALDGSTVTTAANGKPKLIVFYRTSCSYSQATIKSLATGSLLKKNKIDVLALNIDGASKDTVKTFANKYAKGSRIVFALDGESEIATAFNDYRRRSNSSRTELPFIVMIDEHNQYQIFTAGALNNEQISRGQMNYLKDYWDPDADTKSVELKRYADADAVEAGEGTVVKSGSTINIKYGQEFYLIAKGIPIKDGIVDFTEATTVTMTGATEAISYDPATGHLEGIAKGTVTLEFASDYNDLVKSKVKIVVAAAPITEISFDRSAIALPLGKGTGSEATLTVHYNPEKTTDSKETTFTVSDESIVTMEKTSQNTVKVTAVSSGTAIITAKCMNKTATCRVSTYVPVSAVVLRSRVNSYVYVGEEIDYECLLYPENAVAQEDIVWTNNTPDIIKTTVSEDGRRCKVLGLVPGSGGISLSVDEAPRFDKNDIIVKTCDITLNTNGGTLPDGEDAVRPRSYKDAVGDLPDPVKEGHLFTGWYTAPEFGSRRVMSTALLTRDNFEKELAAGMTLYAGWKEVAADEITILSVEEPVFTGAALKPKAVVYFGTTLLTEGKDYTATYKNNKNAYVLAEGEEGFDAKKAPSVTVKGKGNFAGSATCYFRIRRICIDIDAVTIDMSKLTATENGRVQKLVPTVKYGKLTLKKGKDIDFVYSETREGAYQVPGRYDVRMYPVAGGNYTLSAENISQGYISLTEIIQRKDLLNVSKLSISVAKSVEYTGSEIRPVVTVKNKKAVLTEGTDYTLAYQNNKEIGTATVLVMGKGAFCGTKKLTFKITGTSIAKAAVSLAATQYEYDGDPSGFRPGVEVRLNKTDTETLTENVDYTVKYDKNVNKGKGIVYIYGIGKYTGTAKATFNIGAASVEAAEVKAAGASDIEVTYVKGGVNPEVSVIVGGRELAKGKDYTVKYSNSNKIYGLREGDAEFEARKAPFITVTGKGNYKGSRKVFYRINASALENTTPDVEITAPDVIYNKAKGKFKSAVTVLDTNGKKLAAGKDYDVAFKYNGAATMTDGTTRDDGVFADLKNDSPVAGTRMVAVVTGKGFYEGTSLTADYRVIESNKTIASGITFKVEPKVYTGSAVTLSKAEIVITPSKSREGFTADDFEIVEGSYVSNINKGTAKVTLHGTGEYGGYKVVTFKIVARSVNP